MWTKNSSANPRSIDCLFDISNTHQSFACLGNLKGILELS